MFFTFFHDSDTYGTCMVQYVFCIFQSPGACCLAVGLRPEYLPADGQGLMTAWSTGSPVLKPEGGRAS